MNLAPDHEFRLTDRYATLEGEILVTGVQALVRLPFDQVRHDRANGHNTAAFVSGYQGSPLGGYDRELMAQTELLKELNVVHRSGLNEELAATAVVGSQLVSTLKTANKDGADRRAAFIQSVAFNVRSSKFEVRSFRPPTSLFSPLPSVIRNPSSAHCLLLTPSSLLPPSGPFEVRLARSERSSPARWDRRALPR